MGELLAMRNRQGSNEMRETLRMRLWPSLRWEEGAADLRESPESPLGHRANVPAGPQGQNPREQTGEG